MIAAAEFLNLLRVAASGHLAARIRSTLHGSLALTGKGHATDRAIALGFLGWRPANLDQGAAERQLQLLYNTRTLQPVGLPALTFDPAADIAFDFGPPLPGHPNGMVFSALDAGGSLLISETYYSTGGGSIETAGEHGRSKVTTPLAAASWPYPFRSGAEMLRMARDNGLSIASLQRANELQVRSASQIETGVAQIWTAMNSCIQRGLSTDGELPGGLHVRRRAKNIYQQLLAEQLESLGHPHLTSDWLAVYAMAVNEENAAGGQVVTSPTNGSAGVVPAILRYYLNHCRDANPVKISDYLLTAAAIGGLIKHSASISGAEVGCQGEVGSAAAMAAAGLCCLLGGTPEQVENAAEIALEHHLGMTCDPAGGLVQIPCIERNAIGANKAVAAASLALRGNGSHFIPLDNCIEAMRQTGEDMSSKYKETSLGGLAANLPEC